MEWFKFDIKEVCKVADGLLRGNVHFRFTMNRPDGVVDDDGPVQPSIEVIAFVILDARASYEEAEQALLDEARRLLSEALWRCDGNTPQGIRSAVDHDREQQERRWQEESDAELAKALKYIG